MSTQFIKTFWFQAIQFSQTVLIQTIQLSINTQFTVLFQAVQFSIKFSSIWPIDRILSGALTPGQSGLYSDDNEGVLRIPQSSSGTATSPSDCLVLYSEQSATSVLGMTPTEYTDCISAVGVFYSPSQLGKRQRGWRIIDANWKESITQQPELNCKISSNNLINH